MDRQLSSQLPTVGVSGVAALLAHLNRLGVSARMIRARTGIESEGLSPESRIPLSNYHALWQLALEENRDPALGLTLGRQNEPHLMGLVSSLARHSDTVGEALREYSRLAGLVNESMTIELHDGPEPMGGDGQVCLSYLYHFPEFYCPAECERALLLMLKRCQQWAGQSIQLSAVHLAHAPQGPESLYRKAFNCPVYFDEPVCRVYFSRHYLSYPMRGTNPFVRHALRQQADLLLNRIKTSSLAEKVRSVLLDDPDASELSLDRIAERFHLTRQSLIHRLKAEGVAFKSLLEKVRFERAKHLLKQTRLTNSEIAVALGFSELSAFSRAFKRWSGLSPKAFREQLCV